MWFMGKVIFCIFQGFTLEFFFESNDFFANTMLTKEYIMRSEPDKEEPFGFEGPEIIKCKGYVQTCLHSVTAVSYGFDVLQFGTSETFYFLQKFFYR